MGQKNYSKFSQKFKKTEKNNNTNNDPIDGQVTVDEINPEANKVNDYAIVTIGFVTGCKKLYVRKESNKDSESLCIINENEEVKVDLKASTTEDFYKVSTSSGIEGYCMKKYIMIPITSVE